MRGQPQLEEYATGAPNRALLAINQEFPAAELLMHRHLILGAPWMRSLDEALQFTDGAFTSSQLSNLRSQATGRVAVYGIRQHTFNCGADLCGCCGWWQRDAGTERLDSLSVGILITSHRHADERNSVCECRHDRTMARMSHNRCGVRKNRLVRQPVID